MKLEHHHRRIRRKSRAIHLLMLPAALAAGFAWLYLAMGVCGEADGEAALSACRAFSALPFAPTAVGLMILAFIAWDLVEVGRDWHQEQSGRRPGRHVKHARRGYRAIDERHRRHVRWAALHVLAITLAVAGWIVHMWYRTTH